MLNEQEKLAIFSVTRSSWEKLLLIRATVPYGRPHHIGQRVLESPSYYRLKGYKFKLEFENPLSALDVDNIIDVGYWINQSFIIRLCAILEHFKILQRNGRIDSTLPGAIDLDLLRRLRNKFAHKVNFDPESIDDATLYQAVLDHYKNDIFATQSTQRFPIPIDQVIEPMYNNIVRYIEHWSLK